MAVCDLCLGEMTDVASCTVDHVELRGRRWAFGRYGDEIGWPSARGRCGDCGVVRGGLHHVGCDIQECPRCKGQFISCWCWLDDDEDEVEPPLFAGGCRVA